MRRTWLRWIVAVLLVASCKKEESTVTLDTAVSDTGTTAMTTTTTGTVAQTNEARFREQLAREYGDLNPAQQAWNPPAKAQLYKRQLVTYRIAPKGAPGSVTENMLGTGTPQTWQGNISARVKAQLTGPAFDIEPKEAIVHPLAPGQAVAWTWWITPN